MGQYYKAIIIPMLKDVRVLDSWAHNDGAKLMEHSYMGNDFVMDAVIQMISDNPVRLAWVGDYSKGGPDEWTDVKKSFHREIFDIAWGGEDKGYSNNKRYKCIQDLYIINLDKGEYCTFSPFPDNCRICSLPLLCAVGNGLGGGDYHGINMEMIGSWAYDELRVTTRRPLGIRCLDGVFEEKE